MICAACIWHRAILRRCGGFPGLTSGSGVLAPLPQAFARIHFWGAALFARRRMIAVITKASMTSETCRCHPCHEHVSLWSKPSSFLAVSELSSIARRCPSTFTSVSMGVPLGHYVEKKVRSPSAMVRRISRRVSISRNGWRHNWQSREHQFQIGPVKEPRVLGASAHR
jgi:hypothetical protein